MTIRTTEKTVTFVKPFTLSAFDEALPAGRYVVATDEELVESGAFQAYRRIATTISVRPPGADFGTLQTVPVDPHELELALARDSA
ncbi:MAG: hypothetical protein EXQ93_00290 [Alphaproteobacteria bacterium]|nr:hypothetical protein [Alphaproteobacteria bacterium]